MAGRRINDHGSWIGMGKKGVPLPLESKMKEERSASGEPAHIGTEYSDTTEAIHRDQEHGMSKAKAHPMKSGYRY